MDDFQARNNLRRVEEELHCANIMLGRSDQIIVELNAWIKHYRNRKQQLVDYLYRSTYQFESDQVVLSRSEFDKLAYVQRHKCLLEKRRKVDVAMDEVMDRMQYIVSVLEDEHLLINNNVFQLNQQFNEIDQLLYQSDR